VATWSGIKKRAEELIPHRPVVPGIDYALTEVVHCKSRKETGVSSALATCVDLHFDKVMRISAASVVVALGKARKIMRDTFGIPSSESLVEREIAGRMRLIAFLGHPTGPEVRTFAAVYPNELARIRETVSTTIGNRSR
jgi:hypothetical protein